jgi:hypothetical protein
LLETFSSLFAQGFVLIENVFRYIIWGILIHSSLVEVSDATMAQRLNLYPTFDKFFFLMRLDVMVF